MVPSRGRASDGASILKSIGLVTDNSVSVAIEHAKDIALLPHSIGE
jgi:hypothetical protein